MPKPTFVQHIILNHYVHDKAMILAPCLSLAFTSQLCRIPRLAVTGVPSAPPLPGTSPYPVLFVPIRGRAPRADGRERFGK